MPGEPIDNLGQLITPVAPITVGRVVMVPCYVIALGATQNGIPLLTLTPYHKTPNGSTPSNISSLYSTQVELKK